MTMFSPFRIAQERRPGKGSYVRDTLRSRDRRGGSGGGRSHRAYQGEHPVLYQLLGVGYGGFRFVGVVHELEFQLTSVHAAVLVGFMERGLYAEAHIYAELVGRAAEGGGLAEEDVVVEHSGFAERSGFRLFDGGGHRLIAGRGALIRLRFAIRPGQPAAGGRD